MCPTGAHVNQRRLAQGRHDRALDSGFARILDDGDSGANVGSWIVARGTPPASFHAIPAGRGRVWRLLPAFVAMLAGNVDLALKTGGGRAKSRFIFASSIRANAVSHAIFEQFLPTALAEGRYRTASEALLVGRGLDQIPAAIGRPRQGVSARKVAV